MNLYVHCNKCHVQLNIDVSPTCLGDSLYATLRTIPREALNAFFDFIKKHPDNQQGYQYLDISA